MKIGVPREIAVDERRVALTPEAAGRLAAGGAQVLVEAGAGQGAHFSDRVYQEAGGVIVPDAPTLYREAEVVLKVQKPIFNPQLGRQEVDLMHEGSVLIALLQPLTSPEVVALLAQRRITSFSMDAIPRITRAQSMDALSSMSTIAGYRAALIGADALGKFYPLLMTAAGTLPPARVLILGAGVAGLQAIATARRLGAVVEAFDTRPVVKEQVQSLGASFVELDLGVQNAEAAGGYAAKLSEDAEHRERELIHKHVAQADVVISTALVPGKRAPVLITEEMVQDMRPGSVIVDLAAEQGGNCALTVPGEEAVRCEVTIIGPLNLPSTMPIHASQMYAKNITSLLAHLTRDHDLNLDFNDEITRATCITHNGEVLHEGARGLVRDRAA